jgi:hypothetical protein
MKMRKVKELGRVLVFATAGCIASHALGQGASELHRTVARDTETRVGWYANWKNFGGGDCAAQYDYPSPQLVTPPTHGIVHIVQGDLGVIPSTGCASSIFGVAVLYQPNPGFIGEDQFTLSRSQPMNSIVAGNPNVLTTYVVTVQ